MEDLEALENWAGTLLARMAPAARRAVAMDIARALRRSQQQRIKDQRAPDGSAFAPRKPRENQGGRLRAKAGRIKRRAMFAKLRTAKHMKIQTDAEGFTIGWAGRVARIARVHQDGMESQVGRGATYLYPVRQLLGLSQADRDMIRDMLIERLAP
jgi:phage virion morphogenesis protein